MRRPCIGLILVVAYAMGQQPSVETAWQMVAKGQRSQAEALLRDIVKADPRNVDARLLLGSLYIEDGQRSDAIDQLKEAVRLRPKSADAHNTLGEAYNAFSEPKNARPEFQRAVELDPRHAQAHVNLAAIQLQDGEGELAGGHLDQAIKLFGAKPDAAYPRYLRAKVYGDQRDSAKAAAQLEQAVALRPDFAEAWSDLGEARKNLGDDAGALAAFNRAVELNPEDAVAQTRLGSTLLEGGQPHDAVPHLERALRDDPKNQSALNALQLALRRDGQTERADAVKKQLAALLKERDKNDQNLVTAMELNNRGAAMEKSGDIRGAAEKYRSALELYPDHVGIRTNLAVALLKLQQWDEGLAQLREAAKRDPGNEVLQKALADALEQYAARPR